MLNPELQSQIDVEIEKATPVVQEFLHGKDFTETVALISKVNKLSDEQSESLELESVLYVLGLSDHDTVKDWVIAEVGVKKDIDQVVSDVNNYIISKIPGLSTVSSMVTNKESPLDKTSSLRDQIIVDKDDNILRTSKSLQPNTTTAPNLITESVASVPIINQDSVFHDVYRELPKNEDQSPHIG